MCTKCKLLPGLDIGWGYIEIVARGIIKSIKNRRNLFFFKRGRVIRSTRSTRSILRFIKNVKRYIMKQDLSRKWMVGKGYWNGYQGHYYGKSRNSTGFYSTANQFLLLKWFLLAGFLHQIFIVFGLVKCISLPRRLSLWIHEDDVGVWGLPNNPAYHTQKLDAY